MTQFIQLHFLTSYPPANLNRDDLGKPKTAVMGGVNRLRISSQSLKRAWRTSDLFETALASHKGKRTKRIGFYIFEKLRDKGINETEARTWAQTIAEQFGKLKKPEESDELEKSEKTKKVKKNTELEIQQLVHLSPEELQAIDQLIEHLATTKIAPNQTSLNLLRKDHAAADIACFGRMLADRPDYNTEAAIQVAHAITTHKIEIEDDFFTAVDDLNLGEENRGAGHLGETGFAAGLFYGYVCINRDLLKTNLQQNEELTQKTIAAITEAVAKVAPTGKQNSFASRAYTSYMLAEKGKQEPRSLAVAFVKPITIRIKGDNFLTDSISCLEQARDKIEKVFGACADEHYHFNAEQGAGTLAALIDFAKAG